MSRLSTLLFAVGFGLFASLTTLTSCGDNVDTPNAIDETKAIAQGKAGTYKVEISMTGDVEKYAPSFLYDGRFGQSTNSRLDFLADSIKNVVFTVPGTPEGIKVIPISEDGDILNHYSVKCDYVANPTLWRNPLVITSRPNSHGFRVTIYSNGENAIAGSRVALRFKSYFNDRLIQEKVVSAKSLTSSEIKRMEDALVVFELGNPKLNYPKYFEK